MNSFLSAQANLSSINRMVEYIEGQVNKKNYETYNLENYFSLFKVKMVCIYMKRMEIAKLKNNPPPPPPEIAISDKAGSSKPREVVI